MTDKDTRTTIGAGRWVLSSLERRSVQRTLAIDRDLDRLTSYSMSTNTCITNRSPWYFEPLTLNYKLMLKE